MNNFIYPPQNNYYQIIIEELRRINDTLKKIDNKLNETHKKENKYLEKDDNYYMI